ncbi:esterase-like activity of phytase family protein [Cochlodiniinecator piscidefendens]|uniref:esterase-like activity of phytase family protein n=1 Tax=Cochlodiniinecator piscidefendens TaxID=2715756 RepID=UPI001407B80E|nr:esterase-like activity of phytase family protein [Cochlodiniinecator piscidefendens]
MAGNSPSTYTPPEFLGRLPLKAALDSFGGFSGVEIDDGGTRFTAITDRGHLFRGNIEREDGRAVRITVSGDQNLPFPEHNDSDWNYVDSEGIAKLPNGRWAVSIERLHRVLILSPSGDIEYLPLSDIFSELPENGSLEALAADANGRLFAIPERPEIRNHSFPVYQYQTGGWQSVFDIPAQGHFLPVGADFGPDGWFYVLERDISGLIGFRSRVRRFQFENQILTQETVLHTTVGQFGNLEGISVWQDETGSIRLSMVSDDDFSNIRRGALVEYRLP